MTYVDGFVMPIPKKNLAAYKKMAAQGAVGLEEAWGARILRVRR